MLSRSTPPTIVRSRLGPGKPGEWIAVYATNLAQSKISHSMAIPSHRCSCPYSLGPSPYLYYYGLAIGQYADVYLSTPIQSNYIGMAPGSILYQVNLLVPSSQATGDLVFQVLKIYNCGFFFVLGCGRSFTTEAASMASKIPWPVSFPARCSAQCRSANPPPRPGKWAYRRVAPKRRPRTPRESDLRK